MLAYEKTFTSEVWEGTHEEIWPLFQPDSPRGLHYKAIMAGWRAKLESEIDNLKELSMRIETKQKDIANQEARRSVMAASAAANASTIAIHQGRNIHLLTTVSIFFLPLTYVTSIFGMTNMPTDQSYWMFGVVTAAICVPFFSLVLSLNNKKGFAFWERTVNAVFGKVAGIVASLQAPLAKETAAKGKGGAPTPTGDSLATGTKAEAGDTALSKRTRGLHRRWLRLFRWRRGVAGENDIGPTP